MIWLVVSLSLGLCLLFLLVVLLLWNQSKHFQSQNSLLQKSLGETQLSQLKISSDLITNYQSLTSELMNRLQSQDLQTYQMLTASTNSSMTSGSNYYGMSDAQELERLNSLVGATDLSDSEETAHEVAMMLGLYGDGVSGVEPDIEGEP